MAPLLGRMSVMDAARLMSSKTCKVLQSVIQRMFTDRFGQICGESGHCFCMHLTGLQDLTSQHVDDDADKCILALIEIHQ